MTPLCHAFALAARGIATFPMTRSKTPLKGSRGTKDASTDPKVLRELFAPPRAELVAIATGAPSGISVLDIDRQHGGGVWWKNHRDRLPPSWTWRTRSGGLHLAMQHCAGLRTRANGALGQGIEIRSTGASAIYWPAAGLPLLSAADPAPWPHWLMPADDAAPQHNLCRNDSWPRPPEHVGAALAGLCRTVATALPGTRNIRLFWGARRCAEMISRGELSGRHAEAILAECAARTGLDHLETARTIASAFRRRTS